MSTSKILVAAIAAATVSLAFAQGTPPRPAADAATGAGQRSTQGTPMGTTGTPGGGGAAAQGSMAGRAAATTAGSTGTTGSSAAMNSGTTAGATAAADTGTRKVAKKSSKKRVAKADRN